MSTYIKCKEVRHIEAQQIENLFAGNIRNLLMDAKLDYDKLYEIRLRVGRPLFLTYDGGECFLRKPGQEQYLVTTEDLKETLEYVTGYSLYAYEDEIRQGFISVQGGHRVGVTGKVVLDRGRIMGMKYISCINVRLAHEIQGCADKVMPYIRTEKWVANTLIISPPRCGKTTLLRDIIRQLSNGWANTQGLTIGVVDERSELAPVLKMRKCPKPLINTFAWAIWLKHLALRHIWLLYYKGSVLSIGFVSFFQFFSLLPRFLFSAKKLLISYPTGNYRNG